MDIAGPYKIIVMVYLLFVVSVVLSNLLALLVLRYLKKRYRPYALRDTLRGRRL